MDPLNARITGSLKVKISCPCRGPTKLGPPTEGWYYRSFGASMDTAKEIQKQFERKGYEVILRMIGNPAGCEINFYYRPKPQEVKALGLRGHFTYKRGKVKSTSVKQHGLFHVLCLPHTHVMPGGRRVRHSWDPKDEGTRCGKPCKQCGYKRKKKR